MATALAIADWLVEFCANNMGSPIDSMSLEKQLYYAQSFHLALGQGPLFHDDFQAWKWGPAIPHVWSSYSGTGLIPGKRKRLFAAKSAPLEDETICFLRANFNLFSSLSRFQLSDATHKEGPWLTTRGNLPAGEKSERIIEKSLMESYYATLMAEGEDALSRHALLSTVPEPRWGWLYIAGICSRRMFMHPMYVKGLSIWGADRKLWEQPATEEYAQDLYPTPPTHPRNRERAINVADSGELRAELRRLAN